MHSKTPFLCINARLDFQVSGIGCSRLQNGWQLHYHIAVRILTSGCCFISQHIWNTMIITLAILGIYINIAKLRVRIKNMYKHISRWHTFNLPNLSSLHVTWWHRWCAGQRWRRFWLRHTCCIAAAACLQICYYANLGRKAATHLIYANHCRTSSSLILAFGVSPRGFREFSACLSQMSVNFDLPGRRQLLSETHCPRFNVQGGLIKLVMGLCYVLHRGVKFDIGVWRYSGFVMLSCPFLDCCKAFSESRPAAYSIDVLHCVLQHAGIDFFGPDWSAGMPSPWGSWWDNDCCLGDRRVAEWISGSCSGYNCHLVKFDWSEWIGENCTCYIPTSTTRCALTHARRDDNSSTDCHSDANVQVDMVEIAPQIVVTMVWKIKY